MENKRRRTGTTTSRSRIKAGKMNAAKRNSSMRQRKKQQAKKRKLMMTACAGGALLLLVLWGVFSIMHWSTLEKLDAKTIYNNVYAGDVNLSGMTKKEALEALQDKANSFASVSLRLVVEDQETTASLGDLGIKVKNQDKIIMDAMDYGKEGSVNSRYRKVKKLKKKPQVFDISYEVDSTIATNKLKEVCTPLETPAVNATLAYDGTNVTVVEGKEGVNLDTTVSIETINSFLQDGWTGKDSTVKMTSKKESPAVTAADLEGMTDVLGTYKTYYGEDGSERVTNIKTGSGYINGTVVKPGEEFSTDALMRPYTEERGYAAAGSYENGTVVETMGGGICQISSTLYNAVLFAELEVTQRQPHSMMVSYVDPSRDAAIADDVKDFKFKNNLDSPVCIICDATNGYLTFTILGKETRPENRSVDFESETLSTSDYETKKITSDELSVGQEETKQYGHKGAEAQLWKIVYIDGEEDSRDVINTSSYQPQNTIIEVGTGTDSSTYDTSDYDDTSDSYDEN